MNLLLIELNEINFDVVESYINEGFHLPNLKKIINKNFINTYSEKEYKNLEPWIQWPTIHTGKSFSEHNIFRLGDIVNNNDSQLFEDIENAGFKVGAISPMNGRNSLKKPSYFIPDPWTNTPSDKSIISRNLSRMISQVVNNNANSGPSLKSLLILFFSVFYFVRITKLLNFFLTAVTSFSKPWRKSILLDLLLHEIHLKKIKKFKPNFSTIFFNSGAHIQHHYFLNSKILKTFGSNPTWYISQDEDPILDMLRYFDEIISDLNGLINYELIIVTALSQKPINEVIFYYRLSNHENFLNKLEIPFKAVFPRMSRDFLITFESEDLAKKGKKMLSSIKVNEKERLFGILDLKQNELFVTLTYSKEILESCFFGCKNKKDNLKPFISFVAIKNGEHQSKGFAYFSDNLSKIAPKESCHIIDIHKTILNFFEIKSHTTS